MAESREIASKKSGFCAIVERLSPGDWVATLCNISLRVLEADEVSNDRHKVKSTSRVFGNGPVQTAPLLEFFEMTLDHRSKPQEILGFQLGHLMATYSRIHLPECVHKVLMTEFMLKLSTSRAGESPSGHDYYVFSYHVVVVIRSKMIGSDHFISFFKFIIVFHF